MAHKQQTNAGCPTSNNRVKTKSGFTQPQHSGGAARPAEEARLRAFWRATTRFSTGGRVKPCAGTIEALRWELARDVRREYRLRAPVAKVLLAWGL